MQHLKVWLNWQTWQNISEGIMLGWAKSLINLDLAAFSRKVMVIFFPQTIGEYKLTDLSIFPGMVFPWFLIQGRNIVKRYFIIFFIASKIDKRPSHYDKKSLTLHTNLGGNKSPNSHFSYWKAICETFCGAFRNLSNRFERRKIKNMFYLQSFAFRSQNWHCVSGSPTRVSIRITWRIYWHMDYYPLSPSPTPVSNSGGLG